MKYTILFMFSFMLVSCKENLRFELLDSGRTGIDFVNRITETDSLNVINFEYIHNGAGVGIVDLNNDDLLDLVFCGNQVAPRIYLNKGGFKFSEISSCFEELNNGQWYSGIAVVDINADGWNDLYFTCTAYDDPVRRKNRFYINRGIQENGNLVFEEKAGQYGIADDSYSVHAAFFDYDRDGDLDLYLLNNYVTQRMSGGYKQKITDGSAPNNDDLYRNNGDGTFSNVSLEAGIVHEGFGLGLALGDVNKDGYPDIYVSNDYLSNDLLYINQGDGTFLNMIDKYLSYQSRSSMGNDMADMNNDGNTDIFTLDMMPEDYHRKKQTINGFGYIYYLNDAEYGYQHQYLRNMLHLHNGFLNGEMLQFSEVGQMAGIYQTEWSWAPLFADFDNDCDKDLFVTNGYPKDMTDKDWMALRIREAGSVGSALELTSRIPEVRVHNFAFENRGNLDFVNRYTDWFDPLPSFSYGAAFADLDNDGDLDYVVNNLNEESFVFRNNLVETIPEQSNYLKVLLRGEGFNPTALGAKVELWSGGIHQLQENFLSRGYASSVDPVIHFGLAGQQVIDSIRVTWPSTGYVTLLRGIKANQVLDIPEKDAHPAQIKSPEKGPEYLFAKVEGVMDYMHEQRDFIDFYYSQSIIPHKFSQIGPCMQKGDLNGDGKEDIIIGATNLAPTMVYLGNSSGFKKTGMEGLTFQKEFSESDFAILDIDLDGDNDVIALAGGYENKEEKYIHYLYENTNGSFVGKALPIAPFPASVVRPCDFDHDGDQDLFIGARISMEIFPFSANSWLLVNNNGEFSREGCLDFYLGMVTDATWSDYDGDGWEDLLVTREWNSMAVIKNMEGMRMEIQQIPEIESKHGIWYSILAEDFDKDGKEDYILGNLGKNHRFTVSDEYPLQLFALDVDLNGTLDPIMTGFWKDRKGVMREYPVNYLDELSSQFSYLSGKYGDYASYSYATIHDILNDEMMQRVDYTLRTNTSSSYILWNRSDGFKWEELPWEAQVAPVKRMVSGDFNKDGTPDVILAGNDHTYDVSTGYYDALKGIVLTSMDGNPLCKILTPAQSGFMVQGTVESLLLMEGDDPCIIAGINRGFTRVFSIVNSESKIKEEH